MGVATLEIIRGGISKSYKEVLMPSIFFSVKTLKTKKQQNIWDIVVSLVSQIFIFLFLFAYKEKKTLHAVGYFCSSGYFFLPQSH